MTKSNTENKSSLEVVHAKHFETRLQIAKEISRNEEFVYKLRLYAVAGNDWFLIKSWIAKVSELEIIAYFHGYTNIEDLLKDY